MIPLDFSMLIKWASSKLVDRDVGFQYCCLLWLFANPMRLLIEVSTCYSLVSSLSDALNQAMAFFHCTTIVDGSLEVKLPTIWTDEKQRWEESEKRSEEERRSKRESLRRKKIQVREKVEKSRTTVFFPMVCGSGGSKSRLAKAAGAEPCGQIRDEKLHAVVAQSTFGSQNAQNTLFYTIVRPRLEVESRKSARRCGAKHIAKSKC